MTILYLALACLAGIAIVRALFPAPPKPVLHNIFVASAGIGIGLGLASAVYFLCLVFAGPNRVVIASAEGLVLVAALAAVIVAKRGKSLLDWAAAPKCPVYVIAVFGGAAVLAAIMIAAFVHGKPHGEWDAWSIWNLRARFFYRAGDAWKTAFSPLMGWTHPEYPPFLPSLVALCWTLAGSESTLVGAAIGFIFVFAGAGILLAAVGAWRGKASALVAGTVLLGTVFYVQSGGMQYADIPLTFYIVAAVALLCLQDRFPEDPRFTIVAGLMAGFSAWTDNEGLTFVVALIVARLYATKMVEFRPLPLGAALFGPLALVAFFKIKFAPSAESMNIPKADWLAHALDISRWLSVAEAVVKEIFRYGGFLIPVALVLALYWFLIRFHIDAGFRRPVITAFAAFCLTLVGDLVVLILQSPDLAFQLAKLERTFLHVWPAGLLAFFLACNAPQLVASKPEKRSKDSGKPAAAQLRLK